VLTTGKVWQGFVTSTFQLPQARVEVLANGVPGPATLDNTLKETPPRILFLGALHPDKGIPELIEALTSARIRDLAWSATLAGGGDVALTRSRIEAAGLADRISVPGWRPPDGVHRLLEVSSILALPSHVENLPLSLLEGMAYGLCPVTTPVGAIGDVIENGRNGLLVPPGRASTLAAALHHILSDDGLRRTLAANARTTYLERFTLDTMRKGLDAIYARLLDGER
jgi:glycosyltransferase involved in cell wall biosynthesis